jgi:hypothetical protein
MRNTIDVTGGKPIAIWLQYMAGVSAINPLVAFYDTNGTKREMLFFYFAPDTTRDYQSNQKYYIYIFYFLTDNTMCEKQIDIKLHKEILIP